MLEWPQHKILIFQTLKGRELRSQRSDLVEIRTHPRYCSYPCYLIRDIVVILVTCKNEEDPLKNKDARVATTQNIDFSNTQGQITLQSEVGSGRNSNSSKILWISLLLQRIKKIRIKMNALEWPQH